MLKKPFQCKGIKMLFVYYPFSKTSQSHPPNPETFRLILGFWHSIYPGDGNALTS
ncbi:hypothetical protein BX666DRAFT_144194 [Dichotomocladium elegans]|nr:hypothetical protein BX666DRAFT_144194 [Dichotomocladium elegans]